MKKNRSNLISMLPRMDLSRGHYKWAWDVIEGCRNGCPYCFARKKIEARGQDFETPVFREDRINEPYKVGPCRIFVNQLSDIVGDWIPGEWVERVLSVCRDLPEHDFIIQTKLPEKFTKYRFPDNCILGVTITKPEEWYRADIMKKYKNRKMCSLEPIQGDFTGKDFSQFEFVVIGCFIGEESKEFYNTVDHQKIYYTR